MSVKIFLNEAELTQAIRDYLKKQLSISPEYPEPTIVSIKV